MPDDLKRQILNSIPSPQTLRQRLAENLHERDFLRKMLRLANEKAQVESFSREGRRDD